MPEGPLGGPRPLAESEIGVQFEILTSASISNSYMKLADLDKAVMDAIDSVMGDRESEVRYGGIEKNYDHGTNTLFLIPTFKGEFRLADIEDIVRRTFSNLATALDNTLEGQEVTTNPNTLDDLPPDEFTFILNNQGTLSENIKIRGK